jgi:hypothetical protein
MSVASGDPGPAPPGPPPSGRARDGLLRWYPRAWRERYGEEFLIMISVNVIWYSASQSSQFWLIWGLYCFVRLGIHVRGELRAG